MFRRDTIETQTERLRRRAESNAAYRERLQNMGAEYRERVALIMSSFPRQRMGFWCERCRKDVDAVGYRHTTMYALDVDSGETVPTTDPRPSAWYEARCPKGHHLIRRITDKASDPYYRLSLAMRRDRARYERDLLQPSDPRFKYVYPTEWKRLQEQRQAQEEILNGERATTE